MNENLIAVDGVEVETVDILDAASLKAKLKAGPVHVVIIEKYAPAGTAHLVYEVTKVLARNVDLTPIDGDRALRVDPFLLALASEAEVAAARERAQGRLSVNLGAVVTVKAGGKIHPDSVFVVTALTAGDTVTLAKLGGTENRYWPKVPTSQIARVLSAPQIGVALANDPRFTA